MLIIIILTIAALSTGPGQGFVNLFWLMTLILGPKIFMFRGIHKSIQ